MMLCVPGVLRALWACVHVHRLQRVPRYVSTMQPADQGQSEGVLVDAILRSGRSRPDPAWGIHILLRLGNSVGGGGAIAPGTSKLVRSSAHLEFMPAADADGNHRAKPAAAVMWARCLACAGLCIAVCHLSAPSCRPGVPQPAATTSRRGGAQ